MSDLPVPTNICPAAALASNLGGLEISVFDLETIRIPAGGGLNWQILTPEGEESAKTINGILVGTQMTRAYWSTPIEESGGAPPDCSSPDNNTGYGNPGGSCRTCPYAKFGSDHRGRGQACKQVLRLFFLRDGQVLPSVIPLPPTSHKACKQYLLGLASRGVQARTVITEIGLAKTKNQDGVAYSQATFKAAGGASEEAIAIASAVATNMVPLLKNSAPSYEEITE